ncbi:cell wall-active antibiotics response protein LiaF [Fundicoccus culcitae]|uniref:Cell wall-active antibiotics response protein LiaF n=1 Tax=Fundicoccus culcitae TaxID=2969821 RepID=A0ABY5P5M0_9LACT|nr:cell wall-active antibiotics response protein LiaF [Fundicoccus culcitae]UUX34046.1 cell wall-active antibiotics response protein LiaF [Fundicoccus culcitae]
MTKFLRNNIFIIIAVVLFFIATEIFTSVGHMVILGMGLLFLVFFKLSKAEKYKKVFLILGVFFIILSILLTESIWLLIIVLLLFVLLFQGEQGHEFYNLSEVLIHPFKQKERYLGIQLVRPQSEQRTLIKKQSLTNLVSQPQEVYPWDDINIIYLGGNSIIDLGNTILPKGESTVVVRKIFGKTRLIIPRDVGLRINVSSIRGNVKFESNVYPLVGENFQWVGANYDEAIRKMNVIVSQGMGDVEVIII